MAPVDAGPEPTPEADDGDEGASVAPRELTEVERARRDELERLLVAHGGNLAAVARVMDRDRALIRRWLQRYGIDPNRYRTS
jgi:transcriptional regulator of acetoin/glycerol metabolism